MLADCDMPLVPLLKVTAGSMDLSIHETEDLPSSDSSRSSNTVELKSLVRPPSQSSLPLPSTSRSRSASENYLSELTLTGDPAYESDSSWVSHVTSVDSSPESKSKIQGGGGGKTAGKAVKHSLKKMHLKLKTKMHFSDMDAFTPEIEEVSCDWQAGTTSKSTTPDLPAPIVVDEKPKHEKKKKRGSRTKRLYKKALKKSELKVASSQTIIHHNTSTYTYLGPTYKLFNYHYLHILVKKNIKQKQCFCSVCMAIYFFFTFSFALPPLGYDVIAAHAYVTCVSMATGDERSSGVLPFP